MGEGSHEPVFGSSLCQGPCLGNFVCFDPDRVPPHHYKGIERIFQGRNLRSDLSSSFIFQGSSKYQFQTRSGRAPCRRGCPESRISSGLHGGLLGTWSEGTATSQRVLPGVEGPGLCHQLDAGSNLPAWASSFPAELSGPGCHLLSLPPLDLRKTKQLVFDARLVLFRLPFTLFSRDSDRRHRGHALGRVKSQKTVHMLVAFCFQPEMKSWVCPFRSCC